MAQEYASIRECPAFRHTAGHPDFEPGGRGLEVVRKFYAAMLAPGAVGGIRTDSSELRDTWGSSSDPDSDAAYLWNNPGLEAALLACADRILTKECNFLRKNEE